MTTTPTNNLSKLKWLLMIITMIIFYHNKAIAANTYMWNGSASNDWATTANWTENGTTATDYPGNTNSNDIVIIQNTGILVNLSSTLNHPIASLMVDTSEELDLADGMTLEIDGITAIYGKFVPGFDYGTTIVKDAGSGTLTGTGEIYISSAGQTNDLIHQYQIHTLTLTNLTLHYYGPDLNPGLQYINASLSCENITQDNGWFDGLIITGTTTVTVSGTLDILYHIHPNNTAIIAAANVTSSNQNGQLDVTNTSVSTDNLATQYTGTLDLSNLIVSYQGAATQKIAANTFGSIDISSSSTVSLTGNITIGNNLSLSSGTFNAGSNTIDIAGNITGTGSVFSSATSTVNFTGGATQSIVPITFHNFTVNGNGAQLTGNLTVNGVLNLTSGLLDIGANKLTIGSSGSITGFSATSYVYTSSTGKLEMTVTTSGATFPVGDDYNPITITPHTGTATYDIGVSNGVTNASNTTLTSHAVNATWTIAVTSGSQGVTVVPQWNDSDELSGFVRANSFVAKRTTLTSAWVPTSGDSSVSGSNPYTRKSGTFTIATGNTYYIGVGDNLSQLPVTLISFNAMYENNNVDLTWNTSSEINNNYFGIERSINAKGWQMIGQVAGHGNSQVIENYAFTDNLTGVVPSTDIYYRLKQVDYNGKYAYSEIRSVSAGGNSISLQAYPNPVGNVLNLSWDNKDNENVVLKLINISGTTVYTENISGTGLKSRQVDLSGFAPGTYILQIVNNKDVISRMIYKK